MSVQVAEIYFRGQSYLPEGKELKNYQLCHQTPDFSLELFMQ